MSERMNINELAKEIHQNAVDHGWWDKPRSFTEIIALCHSELSEALEEYRNDRPVLYNNCTQNPTLVQPCMYENACECELALTCYGECDYIDSKPEGIAIELADCIIRILDYCGYAGIDIDKAIQIKHEYNKTRPLQNT